jgi:hypothetical protein
VVTYRPRPHQHQGALRCAPALIRVRRKLDIIPGYVLDTAPGAARLARCGAAPLGLGDWGRLLRLLALAENLADKGGQRLRTPPNLEPGLSGSRDCLLEKIYLRLLNIPNIAGLELMLCKESARRG